MANTRATDTFVQLIKDLTLNSQDDTDPNNVLIQQFQAVTDLLQLSELVLLTKKINPLAWGGSSYTANFIWGRLANDNYSNTFYKPSSGALKCVLML